jgi:uncharacterized damage-inducible protein DinB
MDPRYPIGRLAQVTALSPDARREAIDAIAALPERLREAIAPLTDAQLDTPYREGGWTVRQVAHHVADSHQHAVARTRYALAQPGVSITAYDEGKWAELPDARTLPPAVSLDLLDALHARWAHVLRSASPAAFANTIVHPDNGPMTLDAIVHVYAWHGQHHTAHVTALRDRMGWR